MEHCLDLNPTPDWTFLCIPRFRSIDWNLASSTLVMSVGATGRISTFKYNRLVRVGVRVGIRVGVRLALGSWLGSWFGSE